MRCLESADVTYYRGNDLRPSTSFVQKNVGKSMVRVLNINDLNTHGRHVDQIQFQEPGLDWFEKIDILNSSPNGVCSHNPSSESNQIPYDISESNASDVSCSPYIYESNASYETCSRNISESNTSDVTCPHNDSQSNASNKVCSCKISEPHVLCPGVISTPRFSISFQMSTTSHINHLRQKHVTKLVTSTRITTPSSFPYLCTRLNGGHNFFVKGDDDVNRETRSPDKLRKLFSGTLRTLQGLDPNGKVGIDNNGYEDSMGRYALRTNGRHETQETTCHGFGPPPGGCQDEAEAKEESDSWEIAS
ncbi:unnamed protein product [Schistosoma mattheei]|uniref:Uncharacterized protein n=1 Tax=Schistosoma mattheei TaxID=31246 RepID=A0A183PF36_9TREM|nr:unnamed protein product [Schistosoma mattheei]